MAVPISNVVRRIVFAPSGVGPYSFTFEILAAGDIQVFKGDTLLTLTTDYTVVINANGTGSVTLVVTAGTSNITIVGARTIQRTTDFVTGGDLFANSLNEELDSLTIFVQQNSEAGDRSIKAPVTDPTTVNMTLPVKADRAGKFLSFNTSTGDPEVVNAVVDVTTVAGIAGNITTVAGISANVTTVAGVAANVTTVAGIAANVTTVAGVAAGVTTVAGISADVTTVAADGTDIGIVAGVSSGINTLAPIAANITTVAGISADVTAVAGDATDIGTVASNIANVNTVAGISANVTTVAADGTDIGLVAGSIANVNTVATNISNVNTVAGINANVTTVAGISADVTTVAGDSADIQLLAANIGTIASKANAGANSDITSLTGLTTPLSVGQGGTGLATLTANNVVVGNGTSTPLFVAPGTSGNVLTSDGTTWASTAATGGTTDKIEEGDSKVEVTDAGTGKVEITVDAVEVADFTTGAIVFNETGVDQDFRVEGDTDANLLFVDASTDKVGIGTNTPDALLSVDGIASFGAGSASTPSIAAAGDLNTGIFFSAANTVDIATDGVARAQINSAGDFAINAGFGSVGKAYLCRAWVNFNGTGTPAIRASGNVSSITDNGTADYTVNFTTAMPDADYAVAGSGEFNDGTAGGVSTNIATYSTSACRINIRGQNAGFADRSIMGVMFFR